MIVVDACAWVGAVVSTGRAADATREVLTEDLVWTAPAHMPIEVLRTLQRGYLSGAISSAEALRHAEVISRAEIEYAVPHPALVAHAWSIKDVVSLYDAPYVSLALEKGVRLVTLDQRLGRAARSVGVEVVVPGESS